VGKLVAVVAGALMLVGQPAWADPIDEVVRDQMAVSHLPGVAVAIVDKGRITKLAGYGDGNLEWRGRVDPDTRFQLASGTKLFTAILLMREVEKGALSLDDPISKFFDGAPDSWRQIRVRQLANHTSGLSEDLGQPRPKTVAEAVAASIKQPLAYTPGTEARYGFTDFTILRAVLEKAGGASLPALIDREIVKPLGLTATGFAMAEDDGTVRTGEILPRRASTYSWTGTRQRTSDFFFDPLGYGAGGLYSSAGDLAKVFAAIDQGKILKPSSLRELETPAALPNGRKSGFGIGWTVREYRGVPIVGHSGGPALADILRIPSTGRTIVVLTNQQNFYPMLAERIADQNLRVPPLNSPTDDRPAVAANLRGLFAAVSSGASDAAFVATGSHPGDPLKSGFGKAALEAVGPLSDIDLVRVEADGTRIYRLKFKRKLWDWSVKADAKDKISDMRPA
jgi:CubicO group peptidase (beta-lactamase class C family)